jgi:hypothetical protein
MASRGAWWIAGGVAVLAASAALLWGILREEPRGAGAFAGAGTGTGTGTGTLEKAADAGADSRAAADSGAGAAAAADSRTVGAEAGTGTGTGTGTSAETGTRVDLSSATKTVESQLALLREGRDAELRATFLPSVALDDAAIAACRKRVAQVPVRPDWEMAEDGRDDQGHAVRRVSMFGKGMTGFHEVGGRWLADRAWCVPIGLP